MPFITLHLPSGCDNSMIEKTLKEITKAGAETLENTLERMVRVTVFESDARKVYKGGNYSDELFPVVLFRVGPGRSLETKDLFMKKIAEILHENLKCKKENIYAYILDNEEGHHFCIGGKPKDFAKKVK